MPPKSRPPQGVPVNDEEPTVVAPLLAPAPDNGVPYGERPPARGERVTRRGKQLGNRIPTDLYERLVACAESTRIPQSRLIERALDVELRMHGF